MSVEPRAKKGATMAEKREMAVREKKELIAKEEKTVPGRYYVPYADIYETDDALAVVMEMPGVEKKDLNIALENDVLKVDGRIELSKYENLEPVYSEYNVGRAIVHAVEQGRSRQDQRQSRRRRPDPDLAQGQARPATQDRDRVKRN